MTKPIIVLDTSVLLSYVRYPDKPYAVRDAVRTGDLVPVVCNSTLEELRGVVARFFSTDQLDHFLKDFFQTAKTVADPLSRFNLLSDSKDSVFFDLAFETDANYLVSFDKAHILAINDSEHPQHEEFKRLLPRLKVLHPIEMAQELLEKQTSEHKTEAENS